MLNRRKQIRALYEFFVLVFLVSLAHDVMFWRDGRHASMWSVVGMCAAAGGLFSLWSAAKTSVDAQWKRNASADKPVMWRLSGAGVDIKGAAAAVSLKWEAIPEVWEDDKAFYFYVSEAYAQVLPKAVLQGHQDADLRALLARMLGDSGRNLTRSTKA